jgi:hypothetical protein
MVKGLERFKTHFAPCNTWWFKSLITQNKWENAQ